jgi:hypothetical protein
MKPTKQPSKAKALPKVKASPVHKLKGSKHQKHVLIYKHKGIKVTTENWGA